MTRPLQLDRAPVPAATVLIRGAHVLDPRAATSTGAPTCSSARA